MLYEVDYAYLAKGDGGHEHAVKLRRIFVKEQLGPIAGEVSECERQSWLQRLRAVVHTGDLYVRGCGGVSEAGGEGGAERGGRYMSPQL